MHATTPIEVEDREGRVAAAAVSDSRPQAGLRPGGALFELIRFDRNRGGGPDFTGAGQRLVPPEDNKSQLVGDLLREGRRRPISCARLAGAQA